MVAPYNGLDWLENKGQENEVLPCDCSGSLGPESTVDVDDADDSQSMMGWL